MNVNVYIASNNTYFYLGIQHFLSGKSGKGIDFEFTMLSNINDYPFHGLNETRRKITLLIAEVDFLNSVYCDDSHNFVYWILPLECSCNSLIEFYEDEIKHCNNDLLSCREEQVFSLIALGMNDSEISSFLGVSIKTIYTHRRNIMLKLEIQNRTCLWKLLKLIK